MFEDQLSVLSGELELLFETELAQREAESRQAARCEMSEGLNQAIRRLRQADYFDQAAAVLADSSAPFCRLLAVFSVSGDTVRGERVRGLEEAEEQRFRGLEFRTAQAQAFEGAVESGDPVVAMTSPREISAALVELFGHGPDDRAYIFPLIVRHKTVGLLYAAREVEMAPIELLGQAAALTLEARSRPVEATRLVTIQSAAPAEIPERKVPGSWAELSAADQEIHLRAQRFARVQVAGMRLFSAEAVKSGRESKDLYGVLRSEIDSAREVFRQTFLSATPTMVDYFHLELVRSLGNEDASLLGEEYPGPLA